MKKFILFISIIFFCSCTEEIVSPSEFDIVGVWQATTVGDPWPEVKAWFWEFESSRDTEFWWIEDNGESQGLSDTYSFNSDNILSAGRITRFLRGWPGSIQLIIHDHLTFSFLAYDDSTYWVFEKISG